MGLEQIVNQQLNKYPKVKKVIKRAYQRTMYAVSPKIKSEGNIVRVSPDDPNHEYFFGYYDKSPWDASDRYMLCLKAKDTWSDVSPKETADILLIDTEKEENDPSRYKKIAETRSWNVQQSCMLQWLGPDFSSRIVYNDFRDGKYVSVILSIEDGSEKVIEAPVYTVSTDGKTALTLDFSRLYNLRPGYGYYNVPEETKGVALPDTTAIWKINLETGEVHDLLKYTDFASFQPRHEMEEEGSIHKVNHLMISPNGNRFMVLYRWFNGRRKYTRLITCNIDGTDMYVLSDDDMVSHCCWMNNSSILAFENKKDTGSGYYLMKDKTQKYVQYWKGIDFDGHPSFSPDGSHIVFDRYPDKARVAAVFVSDAKDRKKRDVQTVARVFAPFKYDNDTRCDLHPRWNREGNQICFDSVFEGHRGLYTVKVPYKSKSVNEKLEQDTKLSVIVPVYNEENYLQRCVDSLIHQSYQNLEIILVDDGSSDNSGNLCDVIAKSDKRITAIHKDNGGLSSARNAGLKISTGDYVTFVDSDDWVDLDIYRKAIYEAIDKNADVVDFLPVYTDGEHVPQNSVHESRIVEGENILYDYLYLGQTAICPFSVCRKIYKRNLFENIRFPEGKLNEDIATNFKVLTNADRLIHISDIGYYYFQNSASLTNGPLKKKDFDLLDASQELFTLSKNCSNQKIAELAEVKLARSYFSLLAKASVGGIAEDISDDDIKYLTQNIRKNYKLLMHSDMPLNRKVAVTATSIDYRTIAIPYKAIQTMRGGVRGRTAN